MDVMTPQRQLIVMRHAKAGELPGGPDSERPLRPRGRRNAAAAGKWLTARGVLPDLVLCSTATRARQTWDCVSGELAGQPHLVRDPRLYQADATELLAVIGETSPEAGTVMYVGHNPAAADLVEALTGQPVEFPTAAIAIIGLRVGWPDLPGLPVRAADGGCQLIASWTPRADVG